ncbi:hypothetical protein TWF106_001697 [Orbilia oligospora]|uniref:Uncharacterized protein n=1 Tax=Orbilia oligospora TaxID=2813651 RepID=A0A7C8V068_ORBOL|nr:hypothetical protein TWF106_001697 [Orbilia oligospora]
MVQILSLAAVVLSAVAAVQSAAVPIVSLEDRSANPANPLLSLSPENTLARRHYVYDGTKLVRTADPSTDPSAAQLHKRYASYARFFTCSPWGLTICGSCYFHEVSYDTAVCIPTEGKQFIVFADMTNASAKLYKDTSDCTGTSFNVAGCRTWDCLAIQSYYTKSVLATVGCTPPA